MSNKITSWSFSRYITYVQCPLKAKLKFIDKLKEPGSPAMDRGDAIHKMAEAYIKGTLAKLPPELSNFRIEFSMLRKQYKKKINGMVVEDTWAFTKAWDETQWNDWIGCWVRIKLDLAHHETPEAMVITDWKTGKFREEDTQDYEEQLELYALAALLLHEHVTEVYPRLGYTDQGFFWPDVPKKFTRADIEPLKKLWAKRTKKMLTDTTFAPKPNSKCKWCHFRKANAAAGGGQCKF